MCRVRMANSLLGLPDRRQDGELEMVRALWESQALERSDRSALVDRDHCRVRGDSNSWHVRRTRARALLGLYLGEPRSKWTIVGPGRLLVLGSLHQRTSPGGACPAAHRNYSPSGVGPLVSWGRVVDVVGRLCMVRLRTWLALVNTWYGGCHDGSDRSGWAGGDPEGRPRQVVVGRRRRVGVVVGGRFHSAAAGSAPVAASRRG